MLRVTFGHRFKFIELDEGKDSYTQETAIFSERDGLTALHMAAERGHADVILYLIRLGLV